MRIAVSRRTLLARSGLAAMGGVALAGTGGTLLNGLLSAPAFAHNHGAAVGKAAPVFTTTDVTGAPVDLSALKGKLVVLEWTNDGCPFVRKHYDTGNMQALQAEATGKGVVWISIISSAEGQQGHLTPEQAVARMDTEGWKSSHKILDPSGKIGRMYDAKVTPHMYIIGTDGTLLYNGAIDDRPTTKKEDVEGANNYVRAALTDAMAGRPIGNATNKPYGCTIKYAKESA